MFPYLPHTEEDISSMLDATGVSSIDDLFKEIPPEIRLKDSLNMPEGLSEHEVLTHLKALADKNKRRISFLGCGSYDHIIPSTVSSLMSRSEFLTSYTPYQAEISQGILQGIFEFQTLICQLTGLDVSNASLYDGHTAAVEACAIAVNSTRKADTILYSKTIHPFTKGVLKTYFRDLGIALKEIEEENGVTTINKLKEQIKPGVAAVLLQTPNFYGFLEDYEGIAEKIHEVKGKLIISSNPMSLAVVKSQKEWGADIAIGDAQVFGLPSYFGGPSVGYIAAADKFMRKMPGRIAGQTIDADGKRAFVLTLQAREQHIKRERATSNICSNQALAALGTTIYLATIGKEGFRQVGNLNLRKAHYFFDKLTGEVGLTPISRAPFFNEFSLKVPGNLPEVMKKMEERGFFPGVNISAMLPGMEEGVLTIAVTEKRTREELDGYATEMKRILS